MEISIPKYFKKAYKILESNPKGSVKEVLRYMFVVHINFSFKVSVIVITKVNSIWL